MIRRPPRSTLSSSSAASDVYKRQVMQTVADQHHWGANAWEIARAVFWPFSGRKRLPMLLDFFSRIFEIEKVKSMYFALYIVLLLPHLCIVIRGDWLWKAANINDKNNSAAVYVQSTVKVHNPLFPVGKLLRNKLMQRFYWSIQSKW